MTLILEVEYLAGVCFAAIGPDSSVPDWPPQPDRVFSALVATWAARGQSEDEAEALRWLETAPPPRIVESGADARTSATVFVPPNDPRSNRRKTAIGVVPALRSRQPRRFPAARPKDPVIRFLWDAQPTRGTMAALEQLARDTAYVGHSASLTRCQFRLDENSDSSSAPAERRVYPGRFQELRDAYERFEKPASGSDRPQRDAFVNDRPVTSAQRKSSFADRWLFLEHIDRKNDDESRAPSQVHDMPDLRACALVAKTIRDTLLAGYQRVGLGDRIPEEISGHNRDGAPSRATHIAIVPLPFVGFPYADGHVLGYAVIPPRDSSLLKDENFRKALRKLAPMFEDFGRRIMTVTTRAGTAREAAFSIDLSPSFESLRASMDPRLYIRSGRTFATATPIALDRHLKGKGEAREEEIRAQIAAACRNIGLPEPEEIVADKHSALEGVPSAYPSGKSPTWMRWQLPQSLASRQLTHAVIRFPESVDGPVVLGAGRFLGLGLCRPLDPEA